jgi:hypothetical protein
LGVEFAKSVGINVDHRRKNRSQEGFEANKARLTNYLSKLVLFPKHEGHYVTKAKTGLLNDTPKVTLYLFRKLKLLPPHPSSTLLPHWSKESAQSAWPSSTHSRSPRPTEASVKNGTTKEMRVKDKRRLNKLLRRITDHQQLFKHFQFLNSIHT